MTIQIKFARKYNSLLNRVIVVLLMSSVISFIIVSFNIYFVLCQGISACFGPNFLSIWPRSFLLVFAFGIPNRSPNNTISAVNDNGV